MAAVSPALREGKTITPGATWNLINTPVGADYVSIDALLVDCKVKLIAVADGTATGADYITVKAGTNRVFAVTGLSGINLSSAGDALVCFAPRGL